MVHTAGIPWMAAQQAPGREPASLNSAVHRDRLEGVGRAAGEEAADLAVQGRNQPAVGHQQQDEDIAGQVPDARCPASAGPDIRLRFRARDDGGSGVTHAVSLPVLSRRKLKKQPVEGGRPAVSLSSPERRHSRASSWSQLAAAAAGRARTTMANPLPYFCNDKAPASLSLLLTRFLTTAFPTLLETMNPIRLGSSAARAAAYNTTFRRPLRTPERTVVEKSVDVRRRFRVASTVKLAQGGGPTSQLFRPTVRCGPCHDGLPGWHGRHGYAYEGGSRASWLDGGYSAEKSACSR